MNMRAALLASSLLYAAPALAFVDPPAASPDDKRIRQVTYDPNNPVEIYAVPGASLRLEFGADETIAAIIASDQGTIRPDPNYPPPVATVSTAIAGTGASQPPAPASCDPNLCRAIYSNIVYIKPLRPLDPQPLFIQTERQDANGKPQTVAYTFELLTRPIDLPGRLTPAVTPAAASNGTPPVGPTVWGVRFVYPDRVKQAQAVAWLRQKHAADAAAQQAAELARSNGSVPGDNANWRYGYRGAASVQPDQVWDDGRSTFLRYNGNRHVPNIYNKLPDENSPTIPAEGITPDETGTTIKLAGTNTKWFIWGGKLAAGCLFDLGPDPEGRTATTVAQTQKPTR